MTLDSIPAATRQAEGAPVEIESEVLKRFIMFWSQALKACRVKLGSTCTAPPGFPSHRSAFLVVVGQVAVESNV